MIRSLLFCAVLTAFAAPLLPAQAAAGEEPSVAEPVLPAVIPLLETAWSGQLPWRPDWPFSIPPDAFSLIRGSCSALTLTGPGGELKFARSGERITAFPVFFAGVWRQAQVQTGPAGRIRGFTITGGETADSPPQRIEILEERDALPYQARYTGAEAVYFVVFDFSGQSAVETWYSGEGEALKVRSFRYEDLGQRIRSVQEDGEAGWDYDYDSFGNVSGVRFAGDAASIPIAGADFSARYIREAHPRYWEGPLALPPLPHPQTAEEAALTGEAGTPPPLVRLSLQWDERGLLTGVQKDSGGEEGEFAGIRYEYRLDRQGNWTERQEFFMIRRNDFLIPLLGETLRRRIEY